MYKRQLDALNKTTNFDDRGYSPISGEGVFKPQDIDTRGSVIVGDNHFKPGRGGDSLTGQGRPMNVWTNGSATSFEDRHVGDYDANDAVFVMRQNLGTNSAPDGLTYITETFEPLAGMDSFAGSLSPVPGDSGTGLVQLEPDGMLRKTYLEPQLGWGEVCDVGAS